MAIQTRRLSAAAIKRLQERVEAEHACGSSQIAVDLDTLLRWHDEQPARDDAIRAEERESIASWLDATPANDVVSRRLTEIAERLRAGARASSSATQPEPVKEANMLGMQIDEHDPLARKP